MLSAYVLVEFDLYEGAKLVENRFPIIPITRTGMKNHISCSRKMLPLTLAHTVTIHKAQGLTLGEISVNLGSRETTVRLSYVALSRVRPLRDICLLGALTGHRFKSINRSKSIADRNKFLNDRFSRS